MGTACDCDEPARVEGCWLRCPSCGRWLNIHTKIEYHASDFHEVRPGD